MLRAYILCTVVAGPFWAHCTDVPILVRLQLEALCLLLYLRPIRDASTPSLWRCQRFLCMHAGIAFAGVHDSFWTHAADVPILARLLREAFVDLHSQPLLQHLHDELTERHGLTGTQARHNDKSDSQHKAENLPMSRPGRKKSATQIPEPPELGDLDLNQIREAEYFFN